MTAMELQARLIDVTERIRERSRHHRGAYLESIDTAHRDGPLRNRLSCGNLAHGFAASVQSAFE